MNEKYSLIRCKKEEATHVYLPQVGIIPYRENMVLLGAPPEVRYLRAQPFDPVLASSMIRKPEWRMPDDITLSEYDAWSKLPLTDFISTEAADKMVEVAEACGMSVEEIKAWQIYPALYTESRLKALGATKSEIDEAIRIVRLSDSEDHNPYVVAGMIIESYKVKAIL